MEVTRLTAEVVVGAVRHPQEKGVGAEVLPTVVEAEVY